MLGEVPAKHHAPLLTTLVRSITTLPKRDEREAAFRALVVHDVHASEDLLNVGQRERPLAHLVGHIEEVRGDEKVTAFHIGLDKLDDLPQSARAEYLLSLVQLIKESPLKPGGEFRELPEGARAAAFHKALHELDQLETRFRYAASAGAGQPIGGLPEGERAAAFHGVLDKLDGLAAYDHVEVLPALARSIGETARGREGGGVRCGSGQAGRRPPLAQ